MANQEPDPFKDNVFLGNLTPEEIAMQLKEIRGSVVPGVELRYDFTHLGDHAPVRHPIDPTSLDDLYTIPHENPHEIKPLRIGGDEIRRNEMQPLDTDHLHNNPEFEVNFIPAISFIPNQYGTELRRGSQRLSREDPVSMQGLTALTKCGSKAIKLLNQQRTGSEGGPTMQQNVVNFMLEHLSDEAEIAEMKAAELGGTDELA